MKKLFLFVAALAVVGLMAMPSQVLALGGPHDTETGGQCANCHIPHSAQGDRLWVSTPTGPTTNWGNNKIGQLCYSCHDGTFVGPTFTAQNMGIYAYATNAAHGNDFTAVPYLPDGLAGTSTDGSVWMQANAGLPYTAATNPLLQTGTQRIQCTSCHFIHDNTDGIRPYLRTGGATNRGDVCEACHLRGESSGNAGKASANTFTAGGSYAQAVSMHPVDISSTAQTEGARLLATTNAVLTRAETNASGWLLGGHMDSNDAGNMNCNTCHAIHGDETTATGAIGNYKLAIANYSAGYTTSPLCYGCHDAAGANTVVMDVEGTSTAAGVDHPIDTNSGAVTLSFPIDGGPNAGGAVSPWPSGPAAPMEVVCSSCHDPHGGLASGANGSDPTQGNDLVGRLRRMGGDSLDWCQSCHASASPGNHHSHRGNLNNTVGSNGYEATDPMTSWLICGDCHGGEFGSTAHNTPASAAGFFVTRDFDGAGPGGNHAASPTWCNACHNANPTSINNTYILNMAAAIGPGTTIGAGEGWIAVHTDGTNDITPAASGIDRGDTTHILGTDGTIEPGNTTLPGAAVWPNATAGSGGLDGVADNLSRIDGTNGMVCESCHNILGNVGIIGGDDDEGWQNNLLLEDFEDDGSGNEAGAGAGLTGATLCLGCHYDAATGARFVDRPLGTHMITGATVTAAVDNNRATTTLVTTVALGTYADAVAAPNNVSYPNDNMMDCDSCHRPHDADTDSESVTTVTSYTASPVRGTSYILEVCGAGVTYSPDLCIECHGY